MLAGRIRTYLTQSIHIAPLAVFRILFGAVMLVSMVRFMLNNWVYDLYIAPKLYFPFYGFEWIKPAPPQVMYLVFVLMSLAALFIAAGFLYRYSVLVFFLLFTYVELIDKTNYLNHYYFISIVSFLLLFVPAGRYFSLDVKLGLASRVTHVPRWMVGIFRLQLGMVYVFAGFAKLNADWLFRALPLRIWLPAKSHVPLIGPLFDKVWVAYVCCWFGALYDLVIPFLLLWKRSRWVAYSLVLVFHLLTALLFQIGMFPYIMVLATLVFFPVSFHQALLRRLGNRDEAEAQAPLSFRGTRWVTPVLLAHFLLQLVLPFRYLFYPGKLFWTEEGYRFSWRVMLMEKAGYVTFYIKDPDTGRKGEVINRDYLTPYQEKMMSTQPDMILQFARFLAGEYRQKGIRNPEVYAESYVTLNGSGTRLYLDSTVNLAAVRESFNHKTWILPYHE